MNTQNTTDITTASTAPESSESAVVPAATPIVQKEDGNIACTALVPNDMTGCQDALVAWCRNKLAATQQEAKELSDAFEHAKAKKWKAEPIRKHAKLASRRVVFYAKMLAALEQGFVIIPNFPVSMFAIRKSDQAQPQGYALVKAGSYLPTFTQESEELPAGVGEYRNPEPNTYVGTPQKVHNSPFEHTATRAQSWDDLEFPLTMAKPEIMQATDRAMALKIFDEMGILPAELPGQKRAKGDPIIVGRLNDPRGRTVTFMIAWHLDTRML